MSKSSDIYQVFLKRYKKYTDIQEKALGIVANRENCLIMAPTGSGKTEAAVLPLLDRIAKAEGTAGIKLIYITPLRALNRDMIKRLEALCDEVEITVSVRHGDTPQSERGKQARRAPQVLITTPETLQSILPTKTIGVALKNVDAVVIDEVHELYHNKRGAQLSLALERLEELAPNFQRVGISATVGDPEVVKSFLCGGRECRTATVDKRKQMEIRVELPHTHQKRLERLAERFGLDNDSLARLDTIATAISNSKSTIIFANTRQVVEAVGSRLLYLNGIEDFGGIGVHHSSLDKEERIRVENQFKEGKVKSIIATSSLELGIDIGAIDLAIQYGSPRQALRLVQRIGRSGHSESGVSKGIVITANAVDALESVAIADSATSGRLESFEPQFNALDVLANQVCGITLDKGVIGVDDLLRIVRRSAIYKEFAKDRLVYLLEFMHKQKMVGFDGASVSSGSRTRMYYYGHLSVIPDSKRYMVKSIADNRIISSLDEGFVVSNVEENSVFITKGLPWKVISIDENVITVEPSSDLEAAIPDWSGEDIPVSREVTGAVFNLMGRRPHLKENRWIGERVSDELLHFLEDQSHVAMPNSSELLIEEGDEYKIIYSGLGTLANEGLSRMLAYTISAKLGRSISIKSSPYFIFIELPKEFDIEKTILGLAKSDPELVLSNAVQEMEIFRYRFVTTAKLFGVIDREATVSKSIAKRIIKVMEGTPILEETKRSLMRNYFDIRTIRDQFVSIRENRLKVRTVYSRSLSPFAKAVLNSAYYTKELIMPLLPSDELVESFSKFLLEKNINILCTYCGFSFTRKLSEIRKLAEIKCPNCSSPMLAKYSDEGLELVKKRISGKRLSSVEVAEMKDLMKQASLFSSYGGKAAVALSTYGVGPTGAARILMMFRTQERLFYMDLIEAQKNFIKNKKYWTI